MKKRLLGSIAAVSVAVVAGLSLSAVAGGGFDKSGCSFNGKKLYGNIQEVTSFPDVKVQVVSAFPDLKVQRVGAFPDKCGKWKMVTSFPDTKVQFVTAFPDVKIKYVDAFPGAD